ncbi:hypothetical protein B0H17DRAFT_1139972 [Mycena rosella]|uniref:RNase III domain-containing protein n=1 Tax=Mycena rosella TaxID=1033263 RepID=A0AAD7D308_MYCRO|nr:hypothetical protein B0H17DRAFT_1139972 [Mycena rosella]
MPSFAAAIFGSSSKPTEFAIVPDDLHINFTSSTPPPSNSKRTKAHRERKTRTRRTNLKATTDTAEVISDTLSALGKIGYSALKQLRRCDFPAAALQVVSENLTDDELSDRLVLGKANVSYALLIILYGRLPKHVLSKGSLTVLRRALVHAAGLKIIANKFNKPPTRGKKHAMPDIFHLAVAALAQRSRDNVKKFMSEILDPVLKTIQTDAANLPSLHNGPQILEDDVRKILVGILSNDESSGPLKRRHSPPQEHLSTLLAPTSPKSEIKRRKSFHITEEREHLTPAPAGVRRRNSYHGESEAAAGSEDGCANPTEASVPDSPATTPVLVFSDAPADAIVAPADSPGESAIPEATGKGCAELDKRPLAPGNISNSIEPLMGPPLVVAITPMEKRTRFIQNKIMATKFDPTTFRSFPTLSLAMRSVVLGNTSARNPLETCGDAAMQLVMSEVVIERINRIQGVEDLQRFKTDIIYPMVSNATFLQVLTSRSYYTGHGLPKFPGDAWEIFAGALALDKSLDALKDLVKDVFDPLLESAVDGNFEYDRIAMETREAPVSKGVVRKRDEESLNEIGAAGVQKRVRVERPDASAVNEQNDAVGLGTDGTLDFLLPFPSGPFNFAVPGDLAWEPAADSPIGPTLLHTTSSLFKRSTDR